MPENKATGLDNFQVKLLKITAEAIAPSLTRLFNFSFETGQFPAEWKQAKICAIFKKGSKLEVGNYRPISILPVVSKVIERIVQKQLYSYLTENNLLSHVQSGFRQNFSTQTSLHRLTEDLYNALNKSKVTGLVAIDLKKAFDTVNHRVLLSKLDHYGVRQSSLQWFTSYLQDRTQQSFINNTLSHPDVITTGVPQGSILGPLLFIIYVNDLPCALQKCSVNMYADDTAFYYSDKDSKAVSSALNEDLENLHAWLCANKLSLHIGKTRSILICNHQKLRHISDPNLNINLGSSPVEQAEHLPYLGIEIDSRCNFNIHTSIY